MAKANNKTVATEVSPKAFLDALEDGQRKTDALALLPWFEQITGWKARMWGPSIIGFGRYHYKYETGREGDFLITGFSPRKTALTIYILPGYRDMSGHLAKLGKHKIGKSCLYINKLADIDMPVLEDMVRDGVDYMTDNYPTFPD